MTAKEAIDVLFNEWKCIDRNDGIHCDRKCETCDLVMDVGIIREAFNMAISALEAQELSKNSPKLDKENGDLQPTCNELAKDICVPCKDTISRTAAIAAIEQLHDKPNAWLDCAVEALEKMPSAQPEPLTDKEQRIFLAAMGREEKVCKQVDEECRDCCEPYEDSLVSVCREITRKVKGALWI